MSSKAPAKSTAWRGRRKRRPRSSTTSRSSQDRRRRRERRMTDPLISVRALTKTYALEGTVVHALRGVTLDVDRGEFVSVIGPSGSGKSTLMHILGCLDQPTTGQYLLDGRDVSRLSDDEPSSIPKRQVGV